jgi:hypothetical protein
LAQSSRVFNADYADEADCADLGLRFTHAARESRWDLERFGFRDLEHRKVSSGCFDSVKHSSSATQHIVGDSNEYFVWSRERGRAPQGDGDFAFFRLGIHEAGRDERCCCGAADPGAAMDEKRIVRGSTAKEGQ